jgi:hypothetical protein
MILKVEAICAEFLEHFLTIIQDEEAQNNATLASGFLRSSALVGAIDKISYRMSFIPLSAAMKAGLIDANDNFILDKDDDSEQSLRARRMGFSFDSDRVSAFLHQLGVKGSELNQKQQLVLTTSCQEAASRVINGSLRILTANPLNIINENHQQIVIDLITNLANMALGGIVGDIHFKLTDTHLLPDSFLHIKRHKELFLEMAKASQGIEILQTEKFLADASPPRLSLTLISSILDELIVALIVDPQHVTPEKKVEHEAKLHLLKLYCTILSLTLEDSWKVNAQLINLGQQVAVGEKSITLPHSISQILDVIAKTMQQKQGADYSGALRSIQEIAQKHQDDLFVWARNHISFLRSSSKVEELLKSVLSIKLEGNGLSSAAPSSSSSSSGSVEKWMDYGIGMFHRVVRPIFKSDSPQSEYQEKACP